MRRQVKTESTRTVTICDLCERQADQSESCWFCHRDVCYKCRILMFFAKSGSDDLIEMAVKVCGKCRDDHMELLDNIQAVLDGANKKLRPLVDTMRAAVKR